MQNMRGESVVGAIAQRPYWYAEDARVIVEAWRRSGVTVTEFATRHGLSARRLSRWSKRLEPTRRPTASRRPLRQRRMRFLPVRLIEDGVGSRALTGRGPSGAGIEIALPDGRTIRLAPGF